MRLAERVGESVSEFVWGTREAEGVGRGRERSVGRGPSMLTQAAHASRDTLGAHATAHASRAPLSQAFLQLPDRL